MEPAPRWPPIRFCTRHRGWLVGRRRLISHLTRAASFRSHGRDRSSSSVAAAWPRPAVTPAEAAGLSRPSRLSTGLLVPGVLIPLIARTLLEPAPPRLDESGTCLPLANLSRLQSGLLESNQPLPLSQRSHHPDCLDLVPREAQGGDTSLGFVIAAAAQGERSAAATRHTPSTGAQCQQTHTSPTRCIPSPQSSHRLAVGSPLTQSHPYSSPPPRARNSAPQTM